ncbi:MAG: potassium channel family protein [Bacteroidota bacterium]|nr:potassium channel family protein [Bacteroidota bacterium]
MEMRYSSYRLEIKNIKYVSENGIQYPRTAIITFLDHKNEEISTELLGYIEAHDIYASIDAGKDIVLDHCLVEDFSLSIYRQQKNINRKEYVRLKGFSARNALFIAHTATDFSYADFGDTDISFEGSHFARGKVLFNNIRSGRGNFILSSTYVKDGHIEFTGAEFSEGNFEFKNSVINDGLKDFQDMVFSRGHISFANTEFNSGQILFINSRFGEGNFSFKISRIVSGKIDFHYVSFGNGDVIFERVEFGDSRVDFRAVDFGEGRVNFNRSVFGDGDLVLEGALFTGTKFFFKRVYMGTGIKDFSLMEMKSADASFEKTDFGSGELTFNGSSFGNLSLKSCHLDHYVDIRISQADILDLSDSIVRDIVDMEPFNMEYRLNVLDLSGMRLLGKLYMDWNNNMCKEVIMNQENTSLRQKSEQFRILKENFNVTGKYEDEDRAYLMFKKLESKSELQEALKRKKRIASLPAYISYGFRWLVFDAAGQYATNPIRVLFTMVVSYLIFSLVYLFMMLFSRSDIIASVDDKLPLVARAFYHSAITFLTIGYGDHYPYGSIRWMSGVEGFIGLFLMSYFTVAFVRKILR